MIKRTIALPLSAALLTMTVTATAQDASEEPQPSKAMLGFIEEVSAGDVEKAVARIARIESITGRSEDMIAFTREELVRRLGECSLGEHKTSGRVSFKREQTVWSCPDGETYYIDVLGEEDPNNPYINVIGIQDAAMRAEYDARPMRLTIPPPAPPATPRANPPSEEEIAAARAIQKELLAVQVKKRNAFGSAVSAGDMAALAELIDDNTRIVYQTRDPFFKTDLVAMQGKGAGDLELILTRAKEDLGPISFANCTKEGGAYSPHLCRWAMEKPNSGMFAMIFFQGERITSVQVFYVKRDEMEAMRQRAIEAGKIDG